MFITRPTIVYISGPITTGGNVPVNIGKGIAAAQVIRKRGYVVFSPHERIVTEMLDPHDYEWWMQNDFREIEASDAMYRMSEGGVVLPSNGGLREFAYAQKIGRTVYDSYDTLFAGMPTTVESYCRPFAASEYCFGCGRLSMLPGVDHTKCRGAA
jgi:Domain of unknown function (DUF4406)